MGDTKRTPFPHQVKAASYIGSRPGSCMWMKMRTGKTLSTILSLKDINRWPVVVVSPKTVMTVWKDEIVREGADPSTVVIVDGPMNTRHKLLRNDRFAVYIVNYEMLEPFDVFRVVNPEVIILDESLKIANITSKRTRYVLQYATEKGTENQVRICLSGAPASEGTPFQLIPQMFFALRNFFGYTNYSHYIEDHWKYNDRAYKWFCSAQHLKELREWNRANSFQLTQDDIGMSVKLLRKRIQIPPTPVQVRMIEEVRTRPSYFDKEGREIGYIPLTRASRELQILAGRDPDTHIVCDYARIDWVLDWHMENDAEPVLVCTDMVEGIMQAFVERAKEKNIRCGWMKGGQDMDNQATLKRFQEGQINMVIGQVKVVKMGLDFSRASTIIYLTNSYSQDDREQSEYRCTRLGKTEPTEIIDLVADGYFDTSVVDLLEAKQDVSTSFVNKYYEEKIVKKKS